MDVSDVLGTAGLSVLQSPQEKFATQMKVDGFNAKINQGKQDNAKTQKNEFLQILVTQLQNQNPLEPLQDKDFIAQMAQLSSVEKLEDLNTGINKLSDIADNSSLYSLIGKRVSYIDQTGSETMGTIDSIDLKGGKGFLSVDGKPIDINDITKVQQSLTGIKLGTAASETTQNKIPTTVAELQLKTNTLATSIGK